MAKLNSMPFNTSNPILYYNKDMFKAAGLDPEKPPTTYEEITKAAQVLSKDGKSGTSFCHIWLVYGAIIEEALTGKKAPKKALDNAAKSITEKIGTYNKTVK